MPLISVGIPVYNGENYLREALVSVREQSWGDLEVIVSDNASNDGTEGIAREFAAADPRIRYHRQPVNLGAAGNYNFTLEQATGTYFMWAAHDDIREPRFIELAIAAFADRPDASSVFSKSARIGPDGIRRGVMPRPDALMSEDVSRRLRAAVICRHPGIVIFGLMPRELLLMTGRHGDYPGADRVLAVELALAGQLVELPEVLFLNRDHPDRYVRIKSRPNAEGARLQEAWWDPGRADRIVLPAWSRFGGYVRAIRLARLSPEQRRRCYLALAAASTDLGGAIPRSLVKDLVRAGVATARRTHRNDRIPTS
jgi:glycosyltransferase involved in cell wall biosynthesis